MKLTRNMKAISKLFFILSLLTALIIGAILSYLWVIGYYVSLSIRLPEKTTVSITNVTFNPQNTSYFNVTLLNPSYSPTDANITQIAASPGDGFLYNIPSNETYPQLPYILPKAEEKTFKCAWDWANYTGETVRIIAFIADGSGPTFEVETPLVDLEITARFDPVISVTHFNITVHNSLSSATYVNITKVTVNQELVQAETIEYEALPYPLDVDGSVSFTCTWNWINYQNTTVIVAVHTLQGYVAYHFEITPPPPITLEIIEVNFDPLETTSFNVTIKNSEFSIMNANITEITVTVNGISGNITDILPSLQEGIILPPEANQTFTCFWNWSIYSGKNAIIVVQTQEGYSASHTVLLKALTITEVLFNLLDTEHFVVTVQNPTWLNFTITTINATVEGITPLNITVIPSLPFKLLNGTNIYFMCSGNWTDYKGENITVTIETLEGYTTSYTRTIPGE